MKTRQLSTLNDHRPQVFQAIRQANELLTTWGTLTDLRPLYEADDETLIEAYLYSESNERWILEVVGAGFIPGYERYHIQAVHTFLTNLRNRQCEAWTRWMQESDKQTAKMWQEGWALYLERMGPDATYKAMEELKNEIVELRKSMREKSK